MSESYTKIRVREGAALPENPDNGHPGQWMAGSVWYPLGEKGQPRPLGRGWEIVPTAAAEIAMGFFTIGGTCLVETEPYDGPLTPSAAEPVALEYGGQKFASVADLVAFVESQGETPKTPTPADPKAKTSGS